LAQQYDVDSPAAVVSAIVLGTLGVLSFIVQPALVQGFVTHLHVGEQEALNLAGIEMLGVAISSIAMALGSHRYDWLRVMAAALLVAALGNGLSAMASGGGTLWTARFIAGLGHGAIITLSFT
jgi:predicted MFS family arabinose efflux permease